jgi:hypothetical protein
MIPIIERRMDGRLLLALDDGKATTTDHVGDDSAKRAGNRLILAVRYEFQAVTRNQGTADGERIPCRRVHQVVA